MTTMTVLDTRWAAVRAGLSRGWIETRQNFTETVYVIGHALPPVGYVALLLLMLLMAQLAGLRLRERWSGWQREPFTSESQKHISIYQFQT